MHSDTLASVADAARANFILARAAIMTGHPEEAINRFQTTLATSKEPRLVAWSHIYLGRMLDLECKRDQAVSEYKLALENPRRAAGHPPGRRTGRQGGLRGKRPQLRGGRRRRDPSPPGRPPRTPQSPEPSMKSSSLAAGPREASKLLRLGNDVLRPCRPMRVKWSSDGHDRLR